MNDAKQAINKLDDINTKKLVIRYIKIFFQVSIIIILINQINKYTFLTLTTIDLLLIFIAYKISKYLTKRYNNKD